MENSVDDNYNILIHPSQFNRPKWEDFFMETCINLAKRSTCLRLQTASVIVKENRIISMGYNGSTPSDEHCCDFWFRCFDYNLYHRLNFINSDNYNLLSNDNNLLLYNYTKYKYDKDIENVIKEYIIKNNCSNKEDINQFIKSKEFYNIHHKWSINHELHAEMNAILYAGKNGIPIINCDLYTLYSPCVNCAKSIIISGITKVYYKKLYKRDITGINFLKKRNINVIQL